MAFVDVRVSSPKELYLSQSESTCSSHHTQRDSGAKGTLLPKCVVELVGQTAKEVNSLFYSWNLKMDFNCHFL